MYLEALTIGFGSVKKKWTRQAICIEDSAQKVPIYQFIFWKFKGYSSLSVCFCLSVGSWSVSLSSNISPHWFFLIHTYCKFLSTFSFVLPC